MWRVMENPKWFSSHSRGVLCYPREAESAEEAQLVKHGANIGTVKTPFAQAAIKMHLFSGQKMVVGGCIFSAALKLNGAGELSLFSQGLFNKHILTDFHRDTGSLHPARLPHPLAELFPPWFIAIKAAALLGRTQDSMVVPGQTLLCAGQRCAQAAGAAGKVNTRNKSGGERDRSLMEILQGETFSWGNAAWISET